jgi:subtilisin family serine protease
MKKRFLFLALAGLIAFTSCQKDEAIEIAAIQDEIEFTTPVNGQVIPGQYIVVFNESSFKFSDSKAVEYGPRLAEVKQIAEAYLTNMGVNFEIKNTYAETIKGFCVKLSDEDANKLRNDKNIKYFEQDRIVALAKPAPQPPAGESIPWGINRVGYGNGIGKVAWIIDSGIDLDHPDLNVNKTLSKDFTGSRLGAEDENGHGTHCAGTVAAIDNTIGVIGVAAGATVVAVRVLDRRGSGAYSGVIAGVDYVGATAKAGDAANMSLGGPVSDALDAAVLAASNKGIYFALAAGNESDHANNHSPARVNGTYIWTISAMDSANKFASFSNYGNPPVDYCAPGVNIYSTYKGGGYTTMSGTSMASPHMCGILLMTGGAPKTDGYVLNDPDGNADRIAHI